MLRWYVVAYTMMDGIVDEWEVFGPFLSENSAKKFGKIKDRRDFWMSSVVRDNKLAEFLKFDW